MGNKSRITGLIAVASLAAALAILWPVVGAASPKVTARVGSSYTDASGDDQADGPDVDDGRGLGRRLREDQLRGRRSAIARR